MKYCFYLFVFLCVFAVRPVFADDCETPRQKYQNEVNKEIISAAAGISTAAANQGIENSLKDIAEVYNCSLSSLNSIINSWKNISGISSLFNASLIKELGSQMVQKIVKETITKGCNYMNNKIYNATHTSGLSSIYSLTRSVGSLSSNPSSFSHSLNVSTIQRINSLWNKNNMVFPLP